MIDVHPLIVYPKFHLLFLVEVICDSPLHLLLNNKKFFRRYFVHTLSGKGKYETTLNHKKLKGKALNIMASNIGTDLASGKFDNMIPGCCDGYFNTVHKYYKLI